MTRNNSEFALLHQSFRLRIVGCDVVKYNLELKKAEIMDYPTLKKTFFIGYPYSSFQYRLASYLLST